uniref:Uncharacterized protein n=1 Tax=Arundo donax TaxID=35708 RepID=A0A0A8YSW6_ARUDO
MSSSLTFDKTSRSTNVTKQSFNNWSPILFLNLFFTRLIVENTLSTLAVATGRINTCYAKPKINMAMGS